IALVRVGRTELAERLLEEDPRAMFRLPHSPLLHRERAIEIPEARVTESGVRQRQRSNPHRHARQGKSAVEVRQRLIVAIADDIAHTEADEAARLVNVVDT